MQVRVRGMVKYVHVRARSASTPRGLLTAGNITVPCALGSAGIRSRKREGDGATPRGRWPLLRALVRRDRMRLIGTGLPLSPIRRSDGWCDQAGDRNYNRPVHLPYPAGHERLWRDDGLYDVVIILDYNIRSRRRNFGSAIFFHLAKPDYGPTQGCVAVAPRHMRRIAALCGRATCMRIW